MERPQDNNNKKDDCQPCRILDRVALFGIVFLVGLVIGYLANNAFWLFMVHNFYR